MNATVREMVEDDFFHGFSNALSALSPVEVSFSEFRRVFARRKEMGVVTLVAVVTEGGSTLVVGTASVYLEPKFIHRGGVAGHVEDVAVAKDCQKRGVGVALVNRLVEVCREAGCYKVILDCDEDVRPFYEKVGFYLNGHAMRMDL